MSEQVYIDYEAKLNRFISRTKQNMLDMREKHCHEMDKSLKQVGKATLEGGEMKPFSQAYHEAKGKVTVLDELLKKIESED